MSMAWSDRMVPTPPLGQLTALEVLCGPCGRARRMEGEALRGLVLKGFECVEDLDGRLVCSGCRERRRLTLIPYFRRAGEAIDEARDLVLARS